MYTFTTTGQLEHADHVWEAWNAYLASELPEDVSRDATGLCCHTCETVVLDSTDVYEVVKDVLEIPCDHPACDLLHRHLYNATYDEPQLIAVYNMRGDFVEQRRESRFHMTSRLQWLVLRNGERVGDAHDTKREALAEMAKRPTV